MDARYSDIRRFFIGGYPPGSMFERCVYDVSGIVTERSDSPWVEHKPSTEIEVCLIGLVAYFESFFKSTFAAALNIFPDLVHEFVRGRDPNDRDDLAYIRVDSLLHMDGDVRDSIGFLLVERMSFSAPSDVNRHYRNLIGVCPFSKDDVTTYDSVLRKRHQVVHHGGVVSPGFARQSGVSLDRLPREAYRSQMLITEDEFHDDCQFCLEISRKTSQVTYEKLHARLNLPVSGPDERLDAIQWFNYKPQVKI